MDQQKQTEGIISQAVDKISSLQTCLSTSHEVQKSLQQSCSEVKEEIYSAVSRQLEALRDREIWLLNQVDTIAQLKEEEVQAQLITVTHHLSSLEEKLLLVQQQPDQPLLISALCETLSRFDDLDLSTMEEPDIRFEAKGDKLRRKIHTFGSVFSDKRPRLASSYTTHLHTAETLPAKFRDFSLRDQNELFQVFSENTQTAFWLQDGKMKETSWHTANPSCKPFSTSQSLSDWLVQGDNPKDNVQDEESVTLEMTHLTIKDRLSDAANDSSDRVIEQMESILASPSEMWLCESEEMTIPCKTEAPSRLFSHLSNDFEDWLVSSDDMTREEKPSLCACVLSGDKPRNMDIENLADLVCVQTNPPSPEISDHSAWLLRPQEGSKTLPPIGKACRANETCQSFSDCVCDENCAGDFIQRSGDKNSPWLVVEPGRDNMFECFDQEFKSSDWLVHETEQTSSQSDEIVDREDISISEKEVENSKWLCEKSTSEVDSFEYVEDGTSLDVSGQWLAKEGGSSSRNSPLDTAFKYHSTLTVSDWLKSPKKEEGDSEIWLLEKKNEDLQNDCNKWLVEEKKVDCPEKWSVETFQNWSAFFSFTKVEKDLREGKGVKEESGTDDWLMTPKPVC